MTLNQQLMESLLTLLGLMHTLEHGGRRPQRGYAQSRALRAIAAQDGISQRDLMEQMDVRPSSMSELLTKLENSQLIERRPNPEDRRQMQLYLSDAGRRQVEEMSDEAPLPDPFDALTDEEKRQYLDLTGRMIDELTRCCEERGISLDDRRGREGGRRRLPAPEEFRGGRRGPGPEDGRGMPPRGPEFEGRCDRPCGPGPDDFRGRPPRRPDFDEYRGEPCGPGPDDFHGRPHGRPDFDEYRGGPDDFRGRPPRRPDFDGYRGGPDDFRGRPYGGPDFDDGRGRPDDFHGRPPCGPGYDDYRGRPHGRPDFDGERGEFRGGPHGGRGGRRPCDQGRPDMRQDLPEGGQNVPERDPADEPEE